MVEILLVFLEITSNLSLGADFDCQYSIDYMHEREYAFSFSLSFPLNFYAIWADIHT